MESLASRRTARIVFRLVMPALLVLAVSAPRAGQVRPLNLEELAVRAETIFSGRCIRTETEKDPALGRPVTVMTFSVGRAVKGDPGRTFTYRQIGGRSRAGSRDATVPGLPEFVSGEEVVLFLYGESRIGLRSPVGFGQGKFSIVKDKSGGRVAVNGFGNARLFDRLSVRGNRTVSKSGLRRDLGEMLSPDRLLDMVETLIEPEP